MTGKCADHLRMDGDHIMAAQQIGVAEARSNTTRGPHATILQGAIDVVVRGARLHEDMIIRSSSIEMPRRLQNGLYHRRVLVEVCTVHTYIRMGIYECNANFIEL